MDFRTRLQAQWYRPRGNDAFSLLLRAASWIYAGLNQLRRRLYSAGILRSKRLPVPVIVVGNVIAGGAGKTPVVIELAKLLAAQGYQPGIVSRGYGRKSQQLVQVLAHTPIAESGDEPALIQRAQAAPVFVGSARAQAAQALLAAYPTTDVIVSDDGLQHWALQRDIEICVFDERGVGNARLLPAGPLREPWPRAVDFILHRGTMATGFALERRLASYARRADGSTLPLSELTQKTRIALAGIAQPEAFFDMLRAQGVALEETLALPDHDDFNGIARRFAQRKAGPIVLICTEKDAVKLWQMPLAQNCSVIAVPLLVQLPPAFCSALLKKLSSLHTTK
jgi:tetraacyldisaccharide 4'-kinase